MKNKVKNIKRKLKILYLFYKDPTVPLIKKFPAIILLGYTLSPIDLIPDFIPILGYLDDYIILPLGIYLCYKLIPQDKLKKYEEIIEKQDPSLKKNWISGVIILLIWIIILGILLKRLPKS
ncbi:MAG: YkvA family protein [Dictyoglomus turgidum]|jgi:uncharacterized membrane protein YkvA (DUF1232 family)|uniref:YkvA family protein n=1 Tax=Dictyoglomus turgidum TaxID=513050 RepID=UPI003C78E68E